MFRRDGVMRGRHNSARERLHLIIALRSLAIHGQGPIVTLASQQAERGGRKILALVALGRARIMWTEFLPASKISCEDTTASCAHMSALFVLPFTQRDFPTPLSLAVAGSLDLDSRYFV